MRNLETGLIFETQLTERMPILFRHPSRRSTQLLRQGTKSSIAIGQRSSLAPSTLLDRLDQIMITLFDTQKLCVRMRSVMTILCSSGNGCDHLALSTVEMSRPNHHFAKERHEQGSNPLVRAEKPAHDREKPEIIMVGPVGRHPGPDLFFVWYRDPCPS